MIQEEFKERTLLAKGRGGATISEVVNLWKSNWPVGKGVNDVDWGVAGKPRTFALLRLDMYIRLMKTTSKRSMGSQAGDCCAKW